MAWGMTGDNDRNEAYTDSVAIPAGAAGTFLIPPGHEATAVVTVSGGATATVSAGIVSTRLADEGSTTSAKVFRLGHVGVVEVSVSASPPGGSAIADLLVWRAK